MLLKKVVHAHKFRKKNLEIIMTHRFRNPRPQKEDTYTNSGHFRQSFHHHSSPPPYLHRSGHLTNHPSPHLHRSAHRANHLSRSPPHPNSPSFPLSSPDHKTRRSSIPQTSLAPHEPLSLPMKIVISTALRRWILEKGFEGYIRVAEATPHPDAFDIAKKLNVDTVMNAMVRQKLVLSGLGEKYFDIAPAETIQKYFAEYSITL